MKPYLNLIRIRHWVKNFLVFLPLFFSGRMSDIHLLAIALSGFTAFCMLSSLVYVLNDIQDIEQDRRHPGKRNRPLAAGTISIPSAGKVIVALILLAAVFLVPSCKSGHGWIFAAAYLVINLCYSNGAKNVPLLDIVLLVSGFLLRILFGSAITDIEISNWLYLTVFASCTYMALGKRRNEYRMRMATRDTDSPGSRSVLKHYNYEFLDKNMYVCFALTVTFYALWCVDPLTVQKVDNPYLIWTVPLLLVLGMKYSLDVEYESDGDPVEVIFADKVLLFFGFLFVGIIVGMVYF